MNVSQRNKLPCLAMFLAASRRSLTMQAFLPYNAHACGICGGQIGKGTVYSVRFFELSSLSIILVILHKLSLVYHRRYMFVG
jgi:hypothetical protein